MRLLGVLVILGGSLLAASCTARAGPDPLNAVADAYVRLVLAVGRHDPMYVDAYYGPAAWKTDAAQGDPRPLPDLLREARDLLSRVRAAPPSERGEFLQKQLVAVEGFLREKSGESLGLAEETRVLYDIDLPRHDLSLFEAARARIEELLPGPGELGARVAAFRARFVVPEGRVRAVVENALADARKRTLRLVRLPETEAFRVSFVHDKPWSAYNWYQGDFQSLIEVNTDLPIELGRIFDTLVHEGYPGHHTYNVLLEGTLVRGRGWREFTVYPLFSPQSLIAEGTANAGISVVASDAERLEVLQTTLAPLAGIDPSMLATYEALREAMRPLRYARGEAARLLLERGGSDDEGVRFLTRYGLEEEDRARKGVAFIRAYRAYVYNYTAGEDLVRAFIGEKRPERTQRFFDLLARPVTPSPPRQGTGVSELPEHVPPAVVPEPRASALGIVLRRDASGDWEALFGRRARGSRFMPGHLAFPGGRLEAEDGPGDDAAYRRCVAREMREETGLSIPEDAWRDAGERTTPPFYPVRFRTRFFVAAAPDGALLPEAPPQPEEIDRLLFASAGRVYAEWESSLVLVPPPVLLILRLIRAERALDLDALAARIAQLNEQEDPLPRIEFVPGIWVLPVRTATLPPATHTNVWMPGGSRFVVIDPGSRDPEEIERLVRLVRRREADGCRVAAVLLTHQHRDHMSGAATLARALGVPVRAHRTTLALAATALAGVDVEPLEDGAEIDLGGAVLRVLHTPGHAPGHLAFHDLKRNVLISGDLVSGLSTILIGGLDGGDMEAHLASLERAAALGCRQVLPSHGPPLPGSALGEARRHRLAREQRILHALAPDEARPLAEIAREAYADTPEAEPLLTHLQARAHLEHLERRGRARREDASGSAWRLVQSPAS